MIFPGFRHSYFNSVRFYYRTTLAKISKLDLVAEGEKIRGGGGPRPTNLTRDQKYYVANLSIQKGYDEDHHVPHLKVVDLEEVKVIQTIRLYDSGKYENSGIAIRNLLTPSNGVLN